MSEAVEISRRMTAESQSAAWQERAEKAELERLHMKACLSSAVYDAQVWFEGLTNYRRVSWDEVVAAIREGATSGPSPFYARADQ